MNGAGGRAEAAADRGTQLSTDLIFVAEVGRAVFSHLLLPRYVMPTWSSDQQPEDGSPVASCAARTRRRRASGPGRPGARAHRYWGLRAVRRAPVLAAAHEAMAAASLCRLDTCVVLHVPRWYSGLRRWRSPLRRHSGAAALSLRRPDEPSLGRSFLRSPAFSPPHTSGSPGHPELRCGALPS